MKIEHKENEDRGKFFVIENGKEVGELIYSKTDDNCLVIEHTQVNDEFRNQHLGNDLVQEAVDHAKAIGWKVSPMCPFAATLFKQNKDWSDLLAEDENF